MRNRQTGKIKTGIALLLLLTLPLALLPVQAEANGVNDAAAPAPHVLLVYDSLARGTTREGNVESLQLMLAAFGAKVTILSMDDYEPAMLRSYTKVVAVHNQPGGASGPAGSNREAYNHDLTVYNGDYMYIGSSSSLPDNVRKELQLKTVEAQADGLDALQLTMGQWSQSAIPVEGIDYVTDVKEDVVRYGTLTSEISSLQSPYAIRGGPYAVVPYYERGNLSELAISYVLRDWLGIVPAEAQTYLLVQDVYPFSDLGLLTKLSDELYESGIPFLISVQPVFSNTDYPAMQRYVDALKQVQSNNGAVLVNAPVVASTLQPDQVTLRTQMASFLDVLTEGGVAPLGAAAELYWSYDEHYAVQGLSFFDSGVLRRTERPMYRVPTNTSKPFRSSLYPLSPDQLAAFEQDGPVMSGLPINTALTIGLPKSEEELEQTVQMLQELWISFSDYKLEHHRVRTDANTVESRNGQLILNGEVIGLDEEHLPITEDFKYTEEHRKSFTRLFAWQNRFFVAVIILSLIVFGILFRIGYKLHRRKYLK
ncbi:hypothetical protein ACFO9Q_20650 [Paenibacillus sp. GCM10023252]|uniref:hypothetical protein n=1 Tax=Paenibacillus sp. GCM10023252 TaxID=3252649 RepID=UPI003607E556